MATKNLKGTQTEKNIVGSYLNETQSYARYTYYAQLADKEQYFPVGVIFRETADNELRHAKVFLKMLGGGKVIGTVSVDALPPTTTAENLEISIEEEAIGGVKDYHAYAAVAEKEGFPEIASTSSLSPKPSSITSTASSCSRAGQERHRVETRQTHPLEMPRVRLHP